MSTEPEVRTQESSGPPCFLTPGHLLISGALLPHLQGGCFSEGLTHRGQGLSVCMLHLHVSGSCLFGSGVTNPTRIHEDAGLIPHLAE